MQESDSVIITMTIVLGTLIINNAAIVVQNDGDVLNDLMDLIAHAPDPVMEALSAQGCTGEARPYLVCLHHQISKCIADCHGRPCWHLHFASWCMPMLTSISADHRFCLMSFAQHVSLP